MAENLPPVPHKLPIVTSDTAGIITPVWSDWFKQMFERVGGHLAPLSTNPSGYHMMPSGLYIQWGLTSSLTSGTTTTVILPANFPNACLQVTAGIKGNAASSTTDTGHFGTGNYTVSAFDLYNRTSADHVFNYMAVGY